MASAPRDRDCEQLEQELRSKKYRKLLKRLQKKNPFLRQFNTWSDVLVFMRCGTSRDPLKDEILRPIFEAHAKDEDPRWRAILLAIFWPGLESIHFKRRAWDPDPDERWQNVVWTFLKVICRIDLKKRPDRLVQKVFNDTVHYVYEEYCRFWNQTSWELISGPDEIESLAGGVEDIVIARIELREAQEIEIRRLRKHMDEGRISEADFLLLVGTRVYGKSVADHAREAGLAYQVAKKRRQRAEATIRRFEKDHRESLV